MKNKNPKIEYGSFNKLVKEQLPSLLTASLVRYRVWSSLYWKKSLHLFKLNHFLLILLPRLVTRCHDGDLHLLSLPVWVQAGLAAWHSMTYCRRLREGVTFLLFQPKVVWFDSAALHFVRTFCVVWAVRDAGVDLQRRQRNLYLESTPVRKNTRTFKGRSSHSSSVSWILTFGSVWVQFQQKKPVFLGPRVQSLEEQSDCCEFSSPPFTWTMCSHW